MGRTHAPFGIKGWIRILPATASVDGLADYPTWWLGRGDRWSEHRVESAKSHSGVLVAKLSGIDDRDAAAALRALDVAVPREAFPRPGENEYYRSDLIGMVVLNRQGIGLGKVGGVLETGANDVLVVAREQDKGGPDRLLPFIADVVLEVDLAGGVIRVDWGEDY